MASAWGDSWGSAWGVSWGDTGAAPAAAVATTGMGPGWNLFHPVTKTRTRKVEDVERDLRQAYARANDEPDPYEQKEAIREFKQVAATALSIAKREDDKDLFGLAQQIIAMRRMRDMQM